MWLSDSSAGSARKTKAKMLSDLSRTRDDLGRGFCSSRSTLFRQLLPRRVSLVPCLDIPGRRRSMFVLFSSIFFCFCKTYLNASCQTEIFGNHTEDVGKFDCFQISHILWKTRICSESLAIKCREILSREESLFSLFSRGTGQLLVVTMSECVVRQE